MGDGVYCRGGNQAYGYQDNVLAYLLIHFTYSTVNECRSVFSLKFKSLGFDISCSVLSPNILTSGLGSANAVKCLQPSRKNLAFLRAQATISALPSVGA